MERMLVAVDDHLRGRGYLVGEFSAADAITGHASIMPERLGVDYADLPHSKENTAP